MTIGIIAEDKSDVQVIEAVTLTLMRPHKIGFKSFVGGGCGRLRRKCAAWCRSLVARGCKWIVVVHDLDDRDTQGERRLLAELTEAVDSVRTSGRIVLIPRREIEAWLLYDGPAIAAAFSMKDAPQLPGNPENLADPKRHLYELIWRKYRKNYVNTIHNLRIARQIRTARLARATSFRPHVEFTAQVKRTFGRGRAD